MTTWHGYIDGTYYSQFYNTMIKSISKYNVNNKITTQKLTQQIKLQYYTTCY